MDGEPRKRSGCRIVLYALFGIGLFVVVAGSITAYFFFQSEQGKQLLQVARDGAQWLATASKAPGTAELRDAGCEAAMVSDAAAALDVFMTLVPEEQKRQEIRQSVEQRAGSTHLDELTLVICTLPRFSTRHLACEDLARTYGQAVSTAPESFFVLVIQQGADAPACQGTYTRDGTAVTGAGSGGTADDTGDDGSQDD